MSIWLVGSALQRASLAGLVNYPWYLPMSSWRVLYVGRRHRLCVAMIENMKNCKPVVHELGEQT